MTATDHPADTTADHATATDPAVTQRHYLTYTGGGLPLRLITELPADSLRNRNTWFSAGFDARDRMVWVEQRVYGAVEMRHDYQWTDDGTLAGATLTLPDEPPQSIVLTPRQRG